MGLSHYFEQAFLSTLTVILEPGNWLSSAAFFFAISPVETFAHKETMIAIARDIELLPFGCIIMHPCGGYPNASQVQASVRDGISV